MNAFKLCCLKMLPCFGKLWVFISKIRFGQSMLYRCSALVRVSHATSVLTTMSQQASKPRYVPSLHSPSSSKRVSFSEASLRNDEYVEEVLCKDSEIKENEMKSFDVGDVGKVLLVRQNGTLRALGAKCTHYGAPLVTGALGDGRVRCPWHGACFNIATGDIEDFPGFDSLPCFQVSVENENVKVRGLKSEIRSSKRLKPLAAFDQKHNGHMVVIGGGPAGATCVESLRQEGYAGKLTMIASENALPYDRIKLSKGLETDTNKLQFRSEDFYKSHHITVLRNTKAVKVNAPNHIIELSDGNNICYSKLFIATGSKPIRANIPGSDLNEVVVLRELEDAEKILSLIRPDLEVVVLGSSFIALEVAATLMEKVKSVTIVGRGDLPLKPVLGDKIGELIKKLFESRGVKFYMNSGIASCEADCGELSAVELLNGEKIPAGLCIMGIGSIMNTDFLKNSSIALTNKGEIEVNEYLQSNQNDVYAGGDIAYAPVFTNDNHKASIGHFGLAHYHGKVAAKNMLDKREELKTVPYFWTMLFGKGIRYAGHGDFDEILYAGNLDDFKFVAFYLKGDQVVAISSCGKDPIVSQYAELRAQGKKLYRQDLGQDLVGWTTTK